MWALRTGVPGAPREGPARRGLGWAAVYGPNVGVRDLRGARAWACWWVHGGRRGRSGASRLGRGLSVGTACAPADRGAGAPASSPVPARPWPLPCTAGIGGRGSALFSGEQGALVWHGPLSGHIRPSPGPARAGGPRCARPGAVSRGLRRFGPRVGGWGRAAPQGWYSWDPGTPLVTPWREALGAHRPQRGDPRAGGTGSQQVTGPRWLVALTDRPGP